MGVVFGCSGGSGPVLLLAIDLTLFWAVGRISITLQRRKLQRGTTQSDQPAKPRYSRAMSHYGTYGGAHSLRISSMPCFSIAGTAGV